jgi:hypothetical protein
MRHGTALAHMAQAGIENAKMFLESVFQTSRQQIGNVAKMSRMVIVHDIANSVQKLFVVPFVALVFVIGGATYVFILQCEIGRYIGKTSPRKSATAPPAGS